MPTTIQGITFYTIQEAADALHVTTQTIRNYLKSGKLKGYRLGHPIWITQEQIDEAIKEYDPNARRERKTE